jgi:hypothetical protein
LIPQILTNKIIAINGTFHVNSNLTFSGCNVSLGKDAVINIEAGYKLTLTNSSNNATILHACSDMWEGIKVLNATSELSVTGQTTIEDAKIGIESANGGKFYLQKSTFNKNYIGIKVHDYSGINPGWVRGCNGNVQCPSVQIAPNSGNSIEKKIAGNNIDYPVFDNESKWRAKQYLYKEIIEHPSLLLNDTISNAKDSIEQQTNIKKFEEIRSNLHSNLTASERLLIDQKLDAISPINQIEGNYKTVDRIFIESLGSGNDLTQDHINQLTLIANQCPYQGGGAVYEAAALLRPVIDVEILTDCLTSANNSKIMGINSQASLSSVTLHPNPTNGTFILEFTDVQIERKVEFDIYDLAGKLIHSLEESASKRFELNLILSPGTYILKARSNGNLLTTQKLFVID